TVITGSRFVQNNAVNGGGIAVNFGGFEIATSIFEQNTSQEQGGAIYHHRFAIPSFIERSQFSANTANQGGAIYNDSEEELKVLSSLLVANQATDKGGAIYNDQFIEISNTTFVRNTNTALIIPKSSATDYNSYQSRVYNSIFFLNTAKAGGYRADIHSNNPNTDLSSNELLRNIVQEYDEVTANHVGVDPVFVNDANDFRLQTNSPAIDAGRVMLFNGISDINAGETTDLAGTPRNQGANIDMGAYETNPSTITLPECTTIIAPENETENLALDAEITWEPAANASAYRVYIGTSAGATNITNGEEVTELTYIPTDGWDENETYYVTVVPFNAAGEAEGCSEIIF